MIANYGFKDGSGNWYITIDTDKCNGCGKCAVVCPEKILEVGQDEIDIFREEPVALVKQEECKKVRYRCAPCRPGYGETLAPCVAACERNAISHSDGWEKVYQGFEFKPPTSHLQQENLMTREEELRKQGWEKRFIMDEPRLSEMAEQYRELDFEVLLEPVDTSSEECITCMKDHHFRQRYKTIYTRKKNQ
ncbi:MAG: 4Fe-4S binding protein [Syntrophaceae bacterium]|nr:4Fe-4S binding protein [Syntrophaceae bacterium]